MRSLTSAAVLHRYRHYRRNAVPRGQLAQTLQSVLKTTGLAGVYDSILFAEGIQVIEAPLCTEAQ